MMTAAVVPSTSALHAPVLLAMRRESPGSSARFTLVAALVGPNSDVARAATDGRTRAREIHRGPRSFCGVGATSRNMARPGPAEVS